MRYKRRWIQLRVAVCSLGIVGALFLLWQIIGINEMSKDMSRVEKYKHIYEHDKFAVETAESTEFHRQRRINLLLGSRVSDMKNYKPNNGKFRCFKSGIEIPFQFVNDDYCDCPHDGSDEPGTNACSHIGIFFCTYHQKANKPDVWVPSSKVNDGICDCCDGSDEWKNVTLPFRFRLSERDQRRFGVRQVPCTFSCF